MDLSFDIFCIIEVEIVRFIVTIIWALLIGAAIAYVLSSMAEQPFNVSQSVAFSAIAFVGILVVDIVLSTRKQSS